MNRLLIAVAIGTAIGTLVTLSILRDATPPATDIVRDIVAEPKISAGAAEELREQHFESLSTIEDVFALPSQFARAEALYAIAGRSDAVAVQGLIFDANRIADEVERTKTLQILFSRLTEQDPQSALALARTEYFRGIRSIESTVWQSWARLDLDAAIMAIDTEPSPAQKKLAVQNLLAAHGYMGNAVTDRIEADTGIGPDRNTRGRYLYLLADRSPAEAIAFIESLDTDREKRELVNWLAWYLADLDAAAAEGYAELFGASSDRERYRGIVANAAARENPKATVDRLLGQGRTDTNRGELMSAFGMLVAEDIDLAMQYFAEARSESDRRMFGMAIGRALVKEDVDRALAWAADHDTGRYRRMTIAVLEELADIDPERAFSAATNAFDGQESSHMMSSFVSRIAYRDPETAALYIDRIDNAQQQTMARQQLVQTWLRRDPEAALDWILAQDDGVRSDLLASASGSLVSSNLGLAMRVLPDIDPRQQQQWREQIAHRLVTERSPADAEQFIRQFEGQEGYEQLRRSLIVGVAENDVLMARQLVEQMPRGGSRDSAYVDIIGKHAQENPIAAAGWLNQVDNEVYRAMAAGQVAANWYQQDASAAMAWVRRLPSGDQRDNAIVNLSYKWQESTREHDELIASIGNDELREQAVVRQIYAVARRDPARARQLLEQSKLSPLKRQQIEMIINNSHGRY